MIAKKLQKESMKRLLFFILTAQLILSGCGRTTYYPSEAQKTAPEEVKEIKLMEGKKILLVAVPNFRDPELTITKNILSQAGADIHIASLAKGDFTGNEGTTVEAEYTPQEVNPMDWDAVAFIGGPGMTRELENEYLQDLAKRFYASGKITSAICVAPAMLANAGLLKGKKATVFPTAKGYLIDGGADYTAKAVEKDGSLITADGPESAAAFANELIKSLE